MEKTQVKIIRGPVKEEDVEKRKEIRSTSIDCYYRKENKEG